MKNIILQHWTGELGELELLSSANIKKYAESLGADYRMLRGQVFREHLTPPCQKIYMLDEEFDEYDVVVMLDPDMFTRAGMKDNIFEETGIGKTTGIQNRLLRSMKRAHKNLADLEYPYWGGAIYRLTLEMRQSLREYICEEDMLPLSKAYHFEDEGIMHRLASLAKMKDGNSLDGKWCCNSFDRNVSRASLIHIRTKITPNGHKRTKIENYMNLVERGIIEK